jgi:hypothetical protein
LALVFSGFWLVRGSAGFARSVFVGPPPSPDISLGLSSATIFEPPPGSAGRNNAGVPVEDENVVRILSADSAASAADRAIDAAVPLDFRDGL